MKKRDESNILLFFKDLEIIPYEVKVTHKEKHSDEIDLYELILILKKRMKYIASVFVFGVVTAAVISFLMPNIYQAKATLWVDYSLIQAIVRNLKQI